nr:MAG TPA: hypothetical protein [Caudoviricetes sp.]
MICGCCQLVLNLSYPHNTRFKIGLLSCSFFPYN